MNLAGQTEPEDQPKTAEYYARLAAAVRLELWRFELNKRHLQVISVILDLSFGWGNQTFKADKLQLFSDLTGLAPQHISATIDDLCLMRIVAERKVKGEDLVEYEIEPDSDEWRCQPRQTAEKLIETLHRAKMFNRRTAPAGPT